MCKLKESIKLKGDKSPRKRKRNDKNAREEGEKNKVDRRISMILLHVREEPYQYLLGCSADYSNNINLTAYIH